MGLSVVQRVGIAAALLFILLAGPVSLVRAPVDVAGHEARVAFARGTALDPHREALLVVDPGSAFTDPEVRSLRSFLEQGGRLLVADAGGAGAQLLADLDAGIAMDELPLYSPAFAGDADRLVATSTGDLASLPREVPLTRPVLLDGGEPLLLAPEPTWRDANANGRPDLGEGLVRGPLAARASVGEGELLVLGTAVSFQEEDAVARALVDEALRGGRALVLDQAHEPTVDPFGASRLLAGRVGALTATVILMGAAGIAALVTLGPRLSRAPGRVVRRRAPASEAEREALSELDVR